MQQRSRSRVTIIGGGVAGLSCARKLFELGITDFRLVTMNLGGRLTAIESSQVNYGAFYVRDDYEHFLPFVRRTRRLTPRKMAFMVDGRLESFYSFKRLLHLRSLWNFMRLLRKFLRHGRLFRQRCLTMSQSRAIQLDPWMWHLHRLPAVELINELNLHYWTARFFEPLVRSTTFLPISQVTGTYFLASCLPLVVPTHEFEWSPEPLAKPFRDKIIIDSVVEIERQQDRGWCVSTASGDQHFSDFVVLATPCDIASRLIDINQPLNAPASVHLVHVSGRFREPYTQKAFHFFSVDDPDIVLVHEINGTAMLYSRRADSDPGRFLEDYQILARRTWDSAFFIGPHMLESDRGDGLFLIGDHSICSLEDAFITGLFAANRIQQLET